MTRIVKSKKRRKEQRVTEMLIMRNHLMALKMKMKRRTMIMMEKMMRTRMMKMKRMETKTMKTKRTTMKMLDFSNHYN